MTWPTITGLCCQSFWFSPSWTGSGYFNAFSSFAVYGRVSDLKFYWNIKFRTADPLFWSERLSSVWDPSACAGFCWLLLKFWCCKTKRLRTIVRVMMSLPVQMGTQWLDVLNILMNLGWMAGRKLLSNWMPFFFPRMIFREVTQLITGSVFRLVVH